MATATAVGNVFDRPAWASDGPLLSLRGVSVNFGGISALADLDLDVGQHDVVAVIGPNGAGKTTALNAVCGIIRSTGAVTFKGMRLDRMAPSHIAAAGIGRSFQDPPLLERETVLENVLCGAYLELRYTMADQVLRRGRVRRQEQRMVERAMTLLDFVGLTDQADKRTGSLSFGARKLVDIVRAMMSGPHLLVLDEPSSGLDAHERHALMKMLNELRAQQLVTILLVEHHMDLVRATATKVLALQGGRSLMFGTPSDVLDSVRFRTAIVGGASDDDELAEEASS